MMDRYALLYGTNERGSYTSFDATEGIGQFLVKIGAADVNMTASKVQDLLRGFETLGGYENEPEDCKPVAVRYAPMHLYKLPEMPNSLKPFGAISISGRENKEGRNTIYTQTTLISQEDMLQKDDFNYLDQLFGVFYGSGGRWFSDKDMDLVREGYPVPDFEPAKVPLNGLPDLATAVRAVESIYNEKNVILKLESGCGFNRRAVELLTQIYSLLQPRLAFEVGFAAYQDPKKIEWLQKNTSMRIFLVPAATDVSNLTGDKYVLIDLNEPQPAQTRTPVALALDRWSRLDWQTRRQPSMNMVFADTAATFQNPDLFVERTQAFLGAAEELRAWARDPQKKGSVKSLPELKAEYDAHKNLWTLLPWGEEIFRRRIPALMGEKRFAAGYGDLLGRIYIAKQNGTEIDQKYLDLCRFCQKMGSFDEDELCGTIWSDRDQFCKQQLTNQKEQFRAEALKIQSEHEAQSKAMRDAFDARLKQNEAALNEQRSAFEARLKQSEAVLNEQRSANRELARRNSEEVQAHAQTKQQLQAASRNYEDAVAKCEAMGARLQPLMDECQNARQELANKDNELRSVKERASQIKRKAAEAEQKAQELEQQLRRGDDRPPFLARLPWWVPLLACFLVGALLCGAIWGITAIAGKNGDDKETQPVDTTAPTETAAPTQPTIVEPTTEAVSLEELNQLISDVEKLDSAAYTDESWAALTAALDQAKALDTADQLTQAQVDEAVSKLKDAQDALEEKPVYNSKWEDPEYRAQLESEFSNLQFLPPEDYGALTPAAFGDQAELAAVFTVSKTAPDLAVMLNPGDTTSQPEGQNPEDTTTEATEKPAEDAGTQAPEAYPYAAIFRGQIAEEDLQKVENAAVAAQMNDLTMLVFGDEEMLLQAMKVFAYAQEPDSAEAAGNVPSGKVTLLYQMDGKTWLDLAPDTENQTWWSTINTWTKETTELTAAQGELNTTPTPKMVLRSDSTLVGIYDYEQDTERAARLVTAVTKESTKAWQTGSLVLVQKDLTKAPAETESESE